MKKTKIICFLAALLLSGCASEPKIFGYDDNALAVDPVYGSGSEAKKYAKAMLLDVDDEGGNYKIYAAHGVTQQQTFRTKLKEPVRIKDIENAKKIEGRNPIDLGEIGLGMAINPVFGFFALDTRSPEEKKIPLESAIVIAHWNEEISSFKQLIAQRNSLEPILGRYLNNSMLEISHQKGLNCGKVGNIYVASVGMKSETEFKTVNKPPFDNKQYLNIFYSDRCYLMAHDTGKYLPQFIEISKDLGRTYAMYLPATLKSEPMILHDGKVMKFRM